MRVITGCLLIMLSVAVAGCGGGGGGAATSPASLTQAQAQQITSTADTIQGYVTSTYDAGHPADSLNSIATKAQTLPNVDSARSDGQSLTIKFKNGGYFEWLFRSAGQRPIYVPEDTRSAAILCRAPAGNGQAIVLNAQADDPGMAVDKQPLQDIDTILSSVGYHVTTLDGGAVTLDALKTLGNYKVIVFASHGSASSDYTVFQTGEPLLSWDGLVNHASDWISGRIRVVTVNWGAADVRENSFKSFWGVTQKFFQHYATGSNAFKQSLFISCACQGAMNNTMSDALTSCGVSAYVGWTQTQSEAQWSAWQLIALLAEGRTLVTAFNSMSDDWKHQQTSENGQTFDADMVYRPAAGASLVIGESNALATITLNEPLDGAVVNDRMVDVSGSIAPEGAATACTLSVNGLSSSLSLDGNSRFSATADLTPGSNTIQVSAVTDQGMATKTITVACTAPRLAFWSRLTWDTDGTDVDLHLVPEGDELWSEDDCYYANKSTAWGGSLDVDVTTGYGPEHITATTIDPGTYDLVVHYYSAHGYVGTTNAQVYLAVGNGQMMSFGPRALTTAGEGNDAGDVWHVCRITFPEGTVEPVNSFQTLSALLRTAGAGKKK